MGDRESMYLDPRFAIAETYRIIRKNKPDLIKSFEVKLNKDTDSPEQAIDLCLEYQDLATKP